MCVKNQGKWKTERRDTKAFNDVLFIAVEITIAIIQLSVLIVSWVTPSLVSFRSLIQDSRGAAPFISHGSFPGILSPISENQQKKTAVCS